MRSTSRHSCIVILSCELFQNVSVYINTRYKPISYSSSIESRSFSYALFFAIPFTVADNDGATNKKQNNRCIILGAAAGLPGWRGQEEEPDEQEQLSRAHPCCLQRLCWGLHTGGRRVPHIEVLWQLSPLLRPPWDDWSGRESVRTSPPGRRE